MTRWLGAQPEPEPVEDKEPTVRYALPPDPAAIADVDFYQDQRIQALLGQIIELHAGRTAAFIQGVLVGVLGSGLVWFVTQVVL